MTVKEAKIALSICPPDDETNPDVPGLEEAREIAERNPPLMAWWEREKNFDRGFGRKLGSIMPPAELAPTIMRGGATIFFASQLIAESMGEVEEEIMAAPETPASEPVTAQELTPQAKDSPSTQASGNTSVWLWRMAGLILAIVMLIILFLLSRALTGLTSK